MSAGDTPIDPPPSEATKGPSDEDKALARYIIEFVRQRNGAELDEAFRKMRVSDFENLHDELAWVLMHHGQPPNWVKR